MTGTNIIEDVRRYANDVNESAEHWKDEDYVIAINDGLRFLYYEFPESRITSVGALNAFTEIDPYNVEGTMTLDSSYRRALVEFTLSRFFRADSKDAKDRSRANDHFEESLRLMGAA